MGFYKNFCKEGAVISVTALQIKQILIDSDVKYLFHANTVATSVTFLLHGGLLSRGAVEEQGLYQTPQESDELDKRLGVFNDIFFDSDDIHARAHNFNAYGPVTFVYSLDVLDTIKNNEVLVTRDNPIRWNKTTTEAERYFTERVQMRYEYQKGVFKQHLTICNIHEPLPFTPHLVKVLIENPNIPNTTYFDEAVDSLTKLLEHNNLGVPLEVRQCPGNCKCQTSYKRYKEGFTYHRFKIR